MAARVRTVAFHGVDVIDVEAQVTLVSGLPAFHVVGLPDKAVAESRERVRGALAALGLALPPRHITVNLAPADVQKEGSHFDLPTRFRVTYLPFREDGYWQAPLDEWRRYQAPEKIQKPNGRSTTVIGVNPPLGLEQKGRKSAKVQVVDLPLGSGTPIPRQISSNTAKFDEPREPKVQVVDSPLPSISCLHSVSFVVNGKRVWASSPFQLSVSQGKQGFLLHVAPRPPMRDAA